MKPPVQYAMMPPRVDAPKVGKMKPVEQPKIAKMRGIDEALRYYLGPTGIPDRLAAVNQMLNPVETIGGSMRASQRMLAPDTAPMARVQAAGDMLSGVAGFAAPMVAASKVGAPAASAVADAFTGLSTGARKAGATVVDRLNQTNPNAPTTLNMFAGWMAKNADHDAGRRAQAMLDAGVSRDDVWRDTGWMRGVDGQMRFEIDDSGFALGDSPIKPIQKFGVFGKMGQAVRHNELSAAYDLPYEFDLGTHGPRGGSAKGPTFWSSDLPDRGIRAGDVQDMGRIRARGADRGDIENTTLHELQHAIQFREGFAPGSNLSDEAAQIAANRDADFMASIKADMTPQEVVDMARFNELKAIYDNGGTVPGDVVIEINDLKKRLRRVYDAADGLRAMRARGKGGALEGGAIDRSEAFDQYRRVAGEVESRNVEARRNMTAAERRATPPWATQDVPDDMQIVRKAIRLGQ